MMMRACIFVLLCLSACSGDTVRVRTNSNNSSPNATGEGFSLGVSTQSADGSVTVSGASGGQTSSGGIGANSSQLRYEQTEAALATFCLDDKPNSSAAFTVSDLSGTVIHLRNPGCASAELAGGEYILSLLRPSDDLRDASVSTAIRHDGEIVTRIGFDH